MEEIFIPASGMAAEDVLISEWLKQPGDEVAAGEPVAIVETDKAMVELSGTTTGRLSRHLVEAGGRAPGGTTVAYVLEDGESEPGAPAGETGEVRGTAGSAAASPARTSEGPIPATVRAVTHAEAPPVVAPADERRTDGRHTLSPRQRRAMAEAMSPGGTETVDESYAPAGAVPANREATAALVSESWHTVPHFSVGRDVRVDGLLEAVSSARAAGTAVTVTDFLALALAQALRAVGEVPDVGLAVATNWGVLIPVLRSLAGRNRRLASADAAPTFATLSNLGLAGVTWFTGVVPVNQVALLTVGEITLRPAVEGRGLVVAPMLTAVVTADHRRYDGTGSARLLGAFVEQLGIVSEESK
jgi:pyruvate dehydrogenase E2 component (dihydrolipoamide acetyltransferase)